jgi:predicted nuclease of predicted toxin-antitoxin system
MVGMRSTGGSFGDPRAPDSAIMAWASANGYAVFTHDLDFGTLLATTRASGPSVIQVRTQDVMPENLEDKLAPILCRYESVLEKGALITVDESRSRVRVLPFPERSGRVASIRNTYHAPRNT